MPSRRAWLVFLVVFGLMPAMYAQDGSKRGESSDASTLRLAVDEVVLTFNAEDESGLPIHDLKANDIRVRDNGAVPRRIVAFDELVNRPIRVGILLDTSESMQRALQGNKAVAAKFLERLFRQKSDEAFVSEFEYVSDLIQPWTGDVSLLLKGVDGARREEICLAVRRSLMQCFGRVHLRSKRSIRRPRAISSSFFQTGKTTQA